MQNASDDFDKQFLEACEEVTQVEVSDAPFMPFGKYAGELLETIDTSYLDWCLANLTLKPDLQKNISAELDRRPLVMGFGKYADTEIPAVPRGYLRWAKANCKLSPRLVMAIDRVLLGLPVR